jgi:ubiquinone/menaquinone biosynthesis C-methylase UbiE
MFSDPQKNISQISIPLGTIVADFGSGSGHYAKALAKTVGDSGKVYAVDVQKEFLSKVKNDATSEGLRNVEVIHGDLEKPNGTHLREGSVGMVLMSNILFQVSDPKALFKEAQRILSSGGILLIIDWTETAEGVGPKQDRIVPKNIVEEMAHEFGFQIMKEIDAGAHHYGIVCKKV